MNKTCGLDLKTEEKKFEWICWQCRMVINIEEQVQPHRDSHVQVRIQGEQQARAAAQARARAEAQARDEAAQASQAELDRLREELRAAQDQKKAEKERQRRARAHVAAYQRALLERKEERGRLGGRGKAKH